jgi:hypothetical protein
LPRLIVAAVVDRMADLAREHPDWGATQVHRALLAEFPRDPDDPNAPEAISLRKVQQELPKLRDRSGRWALSPEECDPAFLLEVEAALLGRKSWRWRPFALSIREVEWIRVIRLAAPELPAWSTWLLAQRVIGIELREKDTRALDVYLAMKPWRGADEWRVYVEAVAGLRLEQIAATIVDPSFDYPD